jgi:hypothetical protein
MVLTMAPDQSNFLLPNATFFIEIGIVAVLIAGAIWLLVRTMRKRSIADELAKLARLRDSGVLTDGEFDQRKAQLLR